MSTEQPTIFFVPGAWHGPEGFSAVRELLKPLGYPTESIAHPSIGAEPPNKTLGDDAAHTRAAIEKLVDAGKKVVVVLHSYGGVVGSCAVEDLGFKERKAAGKEGGVVNLVYMCAFALPKGVSLLDALGGNPLPWMKFKGDYVTPDSPEEVFYHDMSPSEQQKWIARLKHTSAAVFAGKSTYQPWDHMPCTYIFCEDDKAIPLTVQQGMAGSMGAGVSTFSIKASHSPFLSTPQKVVEGIELAAKAGLEK
ncbi:related to signal peptide protein [Rhynchosporium agropyri]|uniref:Related to signal peptide protein n=2 Tax=Rhynchosporium TaxID=38037 RepID=A0A1E1MLB6_RHYSE|nr:related to signal peptide protein [Rhynchosporium agropyri]CZT49555.1 related to signal peptide protein [Rhynchosporium secalis]